MVTKPLRTCQAAIPPAGAKLTCPSCTENWTTAEQEFRSTSENNPIVVTMKVWPSDAFVGPTNKIVGSAMLEMQPSAFRVEDDIKVTLNHLGTLKNPKVYGKGEDDQWYEIQSTSIGKNILTGKWRNRGNQLFTKFCVAGDR